MKRHEHFLVSMLDNPAANVAVPSSPSSVYAAKQTKNGRWMFLWLLECNLTKWKWSPLACSMSHSLVLVLWALQVCVVLCHRVQCDAADLAGVAPFQTWNQTHEQIHHVNETSDTRCFNPLNYQYAPAHTQCPHVNTVYWSISVFCHVACCWEWDDVKRHAFPIQAESEASGARASDCWSLSPASALHVIWDWM